ncbi:MAG: hypothetical protein RSN88_11805 [Gordonibacter sp.]|uniref:hypothetical protein n=1 Tax=Gordonibacter sp. TaxID=1968902 RepID=UPI002FC66B3F
MLKSCTRTFSGTGKPKCWHAAYLVFPVLVPQNATVPPSRERASFTAAARSTASVRPSPLQVGQAPSSVLKEKSVRTDDGKSVHGWFLVVFLARVS